MILQIGQPVRISKSRQAFEREYVDCWSQDIYIVNNRCNRFSTIFVTYAIKDLADEKIKWRFYDPEL